MSLENNFAKILPMDKFLPNHIYTFSLNPCDRHQYWYKADRTDKVSNYVAISLSQFKGVQLYLNTELSPRGRVHYHGTIEIDSYPNILNFYTMGIPHILNWATLEVDSIEDKTKWATYCQKQEPALLASNIKPRLNIKYKPPVIPSDVPKWFICDSQSEASQTI